jgi:hypothetical protein
MDNEKLDKYNGWRSAGQDRHYRLWLWYVRLAPRWWLAIVHPIHRFVWRLMYGD